MESTSSISPISSVAQLVAREHVIPRVYETDDGKHKVVNTHFETLLYNRNGYLQTITNINTISYMIIVCLELGQINKSLILILTTPIWLWKHC